MNETNCNYFSPIRERNLPNNLNEPIYQSPNSSVDINKISFKSPNKFKREQRNTKLIIFNEQNELIDINIELQLHQNQKHIRPDKQKTIIQFISLKDLTNKILNILNSEKKEVEYINQNQQIITKDQEILSDKQNEVLYCKLSSEKNNNYFSKSSEFIEKENESLQSFKKQFRYSQSSFNSFFENSCIKKKKNSRNISISSMYNESACNTPNMINNDLYNLTNNSFSSKIQPRDIILKKSEKLNFNKNTFHSRLNSQINNNKSKSSEKEIFLLDSNQKDRDIINKKYLSSKKIAHFELTNYSDAKKNTNKYTLRRGKIKINFDENQSNNELNTTNRRTLFTKHNPNFSPDSNTTFPELVLKNVLEQSFDKKKDEEKNILSHRSYSVRENNNFTDNKGILNIKENYKYQDYGKRVYNKEQEKLNIPKYVEKETTISERSIKTVKRFNADPNNTEFLNHRNTFSNNNYITSNTYDRKSFFNATNSNDDIPIFPKINIPNPLEKMLQSGFTENTDNNQYYLMSYFNSIKTQPSQIDFRKNDKKGKLFPTKTIHSKDISNKEEDYYNTFLANYHRRGETEIDYETIQSMMNKNTKNLSPKNKIKLPIVNDDTENTLCINSLLKKKNSLEKEKITKEKLFILNSLKNVLDISKEKEEKNNYEVYETFYNKKNKNLNNNLKIFTQCLDEIDEKMENLITNTEQTHQNIQENNNENNPLSNNYIDDYRNPKNNFISIDDHLTLRNSSRESLKINSNNNKFINNLKKNKSPREISRSKNYSENFLNNIERNVNENNNFINVKEIQRPFKSVSNDTNFDVNNSASKMNIFKSISDSKENENFTENFDMNNYEEILKTKDKLNTFFQKCINPLMREDLLENIFFGIKNYGNTNFHEQIKKEFIFYAYISMKIKEKIKPKYTKQKDSILPIPGGNYNFETINNKFQKINIKSGKATDINYDYFSKPKKNFQKFIKDYKNNINEIIHGLKKNINIYLKFLKDLNCWKLKNLEIDFLFVFVYLKKNDDVFSNKKLIFKLLEYVSYQNDYIISYEIFLKLKNYLNEEINEFSNENYVSQITFICGFFNFYFKEFSNNKEKMWEILNEVKKNFDLNLELNFLLINDWDYIISLGEDMNHRYKVANFYLKLIKLLI